MKTPHTGTESGHFQTSMQTLHPRLAGFLEGLCAASVTRYPEYGMFLNGTTFGDSTPAVPSGDGAPRELLRQFFLCVLSDTSVARPQEAEHVVERLFRIVEECHPGAHVHCEVSVTRGWFDGLDMWIDDGIGIAHLSLDWSVS